jgi:molecular chaperone DnaJ
MAEPFKDYFEILGVAPDADAAAINEAYRRRAKEVHPDRSGGNGSHERFTELQDAYETLTDARRRAKYMFGYSGYVGSNSLILFEREVRDLFDDAVEYVKGITGFRKRDSFRLVLNNRFARLDKRIKLDVPLVTECEKCKGFGAVAWLKCEACDGRGSTTSYSEVELDVKKNTPEGTILTRDLPGQIIYVRLEYR